MTGTTTRTSAWTWGGPLLAGLFRQLFRKLTKDVRGYVQKCVDRGERQGHILHIGLTIVHHLDLHKASVRQSSWMHSAAGDAQATRKAPCASFRGLGFRVCVQGGRST